MKLATASAKAAVGVFASHACWMLSSIKVVVSIVVGRPRQVSKVNGLNK